DLVRLAPYAVVVQLKTEIQRTGKKKEDADLGRLIGILRDARYRGYVALEYEAEEDPKTSVPRSVAALPKLVRWCACCSERMIYVSPSCHLERARDSKERSCFVLQLTYSSYLRRDHLPGLQEPRSDPPEPDEMLFIVNPQASELWFKLQLHELE